MKQRVVKQRHSDSGCIRSLVASFDQGVSDRPMGEDLEEIIPDEPTDAAAAETAQAGQYWQRMAQMVVVNNEKQEKLLAESLPSLKLQIDDDTNKKNKVLERKMNSTIQDMERQVQATEVSLNRAVE